MNKELFDMAKFYAALYTLIWSGGSEAPAEVVWAFNEFMIVIRDMSGLTIDQLPNLEEDSSNWDEIDTVLKSLI